MSFEVTNPFPVFTDTDGEPLENGKLFIGKVNLNPETDPVSVFFDEALTAPAAQPIRTIGGYPARDGTPTNLFVKDLEFSITVRDKNDKLVFSDPKANESIAALLLDTTQHLDDIAALKAVDGSVLVDGETFIIETSGTIFFWDSTATIGVSLDDATPGRFVALPGPIGVLDGPTVQEALDLGGSGRSHNVVLPPKNMSTGKITFNSNYQTILKGQGLQDSALSFTHSDGTQAISVPAMASDKSRARLHDFSVIGDATQGNGLSVDTPVAGVDIDRVFMRNFSGAGKANFKIKTAFINRIDNIISFDGFDGVQLVDAKGIAARGWWLADNTNYQLNIDETTEGNKIETIEIGLSIIDNDKRAILCKGNGNYISSCFYENFTASRPIEFTASSFNNVLEFQFSGFTDVFDNGHHNIHPVTGFLPYANKVSSYGYSGTYAARGPSENRFPNSSWGQSRAGNGTTTFGATPATASIDNTDGYLDNNSLKLDWGTMALTGVIFTDTHVLATDDFIVFHFMVKADRDLASDEVMQFIIRNTAGLVVLEQARVSDLRAGVWKAATVVHKAKAGVTVQLQIGLQGSASHTALITNIDDLTISVNKPTFSLLHNTTTGTRTSNREPKYLPQVDLGQAALLTDTDEVAPLSGIIHRNIVPASTTATTSAETLMTYTLPANTLDRAPQGLRIRAWGTTAANANLKTIRLEASGAPVARSSNVATASNGKNWELEAIILRVSKTVQTSMGRGTFNDLAVAASNLDPALLLELNRTIDVVGQNNIASAGDITVTGFMIEYLS